MRPLVVVASMWMVACAAASARSPKMDVQLALDRTELVYQESTRFRITMRNGSGAPITMFDAQASGKSPLLRLSHDGQVHDYSLFSRPHALDPSFIEQTTPPPVQVVAPGQSVLVDADLLSWLPTLAPGHYTLQAIVDYEALHAASAPVKLTVTPLALHASHLNSYTSSMVPWWELAYVHGAADGGSVVLLRTFDVEHGYVRLETGLRVGSSPRAVAPQASMSPPGQPPQGNWIVWVEDDQLAYVYASDGRVVRATAHLALPARATLIGPPLQALTPTLPGPCSLFLQAGDQVLAVEIAATGTALVRGSVGAAGAHGWAAQFRDGRRQALLAVDDGKHTRLDAVVWPAGQAPAPQPRLAQWDGSFVDGALTPTDRDSWAGALLLRVGDGDKRLRLVSFTLDARGQLSSTAPRVVNFAHARGLKRTRLRVDEQGRAHGLVQGQAGDWWIFEETGGTAALPKLPAGLGSVDLLFRR
jgi:hypothetical protein